MSEEPRTQGRGLKRGWLEYIGASVAMLAGAALVWRLDTAFPGVPIGIGGSIVMLGRAILRDGVRGNRLLFLCGALLAVASYSIVLWWFLQSTEG